MLLEHSIKKTFYANYTGFHFGMSSAYESLNSGMFSDEVGLDFLLPSLLWHCWFGVGKSIRPVNIERCGVGVVICLERGADCLHMVQLMPVHPKATCPSLASFKSKLILLVPAYPGCPGKEAVEWQWYQLEHMQTICTSLQTDDHTDTSSLSFNRPEPLCFQVSCLSFYA